jgi:hypothetical protein
VTTVASLGNFLRRKRLWESVYRRLCERRSTAKMQQAQLLASSERINLAGDHFKKVEKHSIIVLHSYSRQVKKKLRNSLPNIMKLAENCKLIPVRLND